MKNKLPCLLLAGAIAFSLAACAPSGEIPSPSPSPSSEAPSIPLSSAQPETPSPSPSQPPAEPSPDPVEWRDSIPQRDYKPWQEEYMEFLAELRAQEWARRLDYSAMTEAEQKTEEGRALWNTVCNSSGYYSLYDVDKDSVPELFVEFGNYEAAYHTQCYTFRDGETVLVGEFGSGHSSLYTYPGESAFLLHRCQMGYASLWEYPMVDDVLIQEREIFQEGNVLEYTEPYEIVPGAEYIPSFSTHRGGSEDFFGDWLNYPLASNGKALLLPICDWYDGPAATGSDPEQARTAILAALSGETELYGASGDQFYGDTGRITWAEYVQRGAAYPFNEAPFQIKAHIWLDLNGDGQEECVLLLEAERDGVEWTDDGTVVLSEQDGVVYVYYFVFYRKPEFCTDGTIRGTVRLSFWQDQCYEYAAQPSADARPVEWQEGAPGAGPGESVDLVG